MIINEQILNAEEILKLTQCIQETENNSKGQELLNKIVYQNAFIRELCYALKHSGMISGITSTGDIIESDYGYISNFINELDSIIHKNIK